MGPNESVSFKFLIYEYSIEENFQVNLLWLLRHQKAKKILWCLWIQTKQIRLCIKTLFKRNLMTRLCNKKVNRFNIFKMIHYSSRKANMFYMLHKIMFSSVLAVKKEPHQKSPNISRNNKSTSITSLMCLLTQLTSITTRIL